MSLALAIPSLYAQESPNEIARVFFKAIQKKDLKHAKTVTHSKFHRYLDFMSDAKLQKGVDTTDRRDYKNAVFKSISPDAGILKIRNGNDDQIVYLARENDSLKVDLMGSAANYQDDLYIVTISPGCPLSPCLRMRVGVGEGAAQIVISDEIRRG